MVCMCDSGEIMLTNDYDPWFIWLESKGELGVLHVVNLDFIAMY